MNTLTLCFSFAKLKGIGNKKFFAHSKGLLKQLIDNAFYRFFYIKLHSKDISAETHDQSAILGPVQTNATLLGQQPATMLKRLNKALP